MSRSGEFDGRTSCGRYIQYKGSLFPTGSHAVRVYDDMQMERLLRVDPLAVVLMEVEITRKGYCRIETHRGK